MDSSSGDILEEQSSSQTKKDEFIGTTLDGKYLIEKRLGSGGMGAVYKGRHLLMERDVAIKLLHLHLAQGSSKGEFLERFKREAKTASKLKHLGAVTIHDFGISGDLPYIIMEFNPGFTLGSLLKQSDGLKLKTILQIMEPICGALNAAHNMGIVHRDLKPDNVMVYKDDNGEKHVQVLDFGIAKLADQPQEQSMTMTGTLVGTPYYMSPEQVRCEKLDSRSDIYSLGIMLYQMLSGELPFVAKSSAEVLLMHLSDVPKPPSMKIEKGKKGSISRVVMKSLEKDPALRQQSVLELFEELQLAINENKSPSTNKSIISSFERIVSKRKNKSSILGKFFKLAIPVLILAFLLLISAPDKKPEETKGSASTALDTQEDSSINTQKESKQVTESKQVKDKPKETKKINASLISPEEQKEFTKGESRAKLLLERIESKHSDLDSSISSLEVEIHDLESQLSIKSGKELSNLKAKIADRKLQLKVKKEHAKLHEFNIFAAAFMPDIKEKRKAAIKLFKQGKQKEAQEMLAKVQTRTKTLLSKQNEINSLGSYMIGSAFAKRNLTTYAEKRKIALTNTNKKAKEIQSSIDSSIHDGLFIEARNEHISLKNLYERVLKQIKAKRKSIQAAKAPNIQKIHIPAQPIQTRPIRTQPSAAEIRRRAEIAEAERRLLETEREAREIEKQIKAQEQKRKDRGAALDTGFKILEAIGSVID